MKKLLLIGAAIALLGAGCAGAQNKNQPKALTPVEKQGAISKLKSCACDPSDGLCFSNPAYNEQTWTSGGRGALRDDFPTPPQTELCGTMTTQPRREGKKPLHTSFFVSELSGRELFAYLWDELTKRGYTVSKTRLAGSDFIYYENPGVRVFEDIGPGRQIYICDECNFSYSVDNK